MMLYCDIKSLLSIPLQQGFPETKLSTSMSLIEHILSLYELEVINHYHTVVVRLNHIEKSLDPRYSLTSVEALYQNLFPRMKIIMAMNEFCIETLFNNHTDSVAMIYVSHDIHLDGVKSMALGIEPSMIYELSWVPTFSAVLEESALVLIRPCEESFMSPVADWVLTNNTMTLSEKCLYATAMAVRFLSQPMYSVSTVCMIDQGVGIIRKRKGS